MVVHWTAPCCGERDRARGAAIAPLAGRSTWLGAVATALVLVIVLVTKFTHGAWIVVIAMPLLFLLMRAIHRHYDRVAAELRTGAGRHACCRSRIHAVVLVSRLHKPTLRALAFARATRPTR